MENTDEEHPAAIADILDHLAGLGIVAHRRTVMLDIEQLIEADVDVVCNKGRQNEYFIGTGHFEAPELKLLIDVVQASSFLTAKRGSILIGKLLALTSRHQADSLANTLYTQQQTKPKNETAYFAADLLFTAINKKHRVRFMYYDYDPDKKRIYKHRRRIY